jgi:hypothetical protein
MNYEEDIRIDETALEIEWLEQPALFMKYSRHAAQMSRELDEVKQNLDIVKAECDRDVRENPDKYNIAKVTEGSVTSAILTSKKYKDAQKDYMDAKFEYDMAQGAVRAFDQRKTALENIVRLHGQQYFAGPKVPRDITYQRQQKEQSAEVDRKVSAGIAGKIQRRK